jgi:hypothetical protein
MKNHMITIVCLVVVSIICLVFTITCASGVDRFIGMEQKDNISPKKSLITENQSIDCMERLFGKPQTDSISEEIDEEFIKEEPSRKKSTRIMNDDDTVDCLALYYSCALCFGICM